MSYNNENLLFLAMAQGGQITPEMMQMMQQSGQLPQMNMGAGLNDIQKMNMKQQSHYGNSMFRYGGVPHMEEGGQQEQVDQAFLSPDQKYSGRVQDFLKQLKTKAMSAVQDEMVNTANDYDQEAAQIDMQNQMRYGGMYAPGGTTFGAQPMLDMSGVNAANAWADASQNEQDLTQGVATTAGAAAGLQGYFSNDAAKFGSNPLNDRFIRKATTTDLETGKRERVRFDVGGPNDVSLPRAMTPEQFAENAKLEANAKAMGWVNPDGTADIAGYRAIGADGKAFGYGPKHPSQLKTTLKSDKKKKEETKKLTPEEEAAAKVKAEQEARIAEEVKKAAEDKKKEEEGKTENKTDTKTEDKKTETKTETKTTKDVGDGMDPWRALADPNSTQAGAYYQLDKKGNKIPMAFYDPNMRITSESADYRVPLGNLFRSKENDRAGVMKKATYTFGSLDSPTQVPNIQLGPNPAQAPAASTPTVPNQTSKFFPKLNKSDIVAGANIPYKPYLTDKDGWARGSEYDAIYQDRIDNWHPGMQIPFDANQVPAGFNVGPGNFTPGAQPVTQAPLTPAQARQMGRQQVRNAQANQQVAQQPALPAPNTIPVNAPTPQFGPAQIMTPQGRMNPYNQTLNLMNGFSAGAIQPGVYTDPNIINSQNAAANAAAGKRYGGEGLRRFVPGGPTSGEEANIMGMDNTANLGASSTPGWDNFSAPAPGPTYGSGPLDKPMEIGKIYQQPGITNEKQVDNKFGKNNPFFAAAALGALDVMAGAGANREADKLKDKARDKFSADQVYTTMNQASGSRGDYSMEGYLRPDNTVPVEKSGYNFQSNYAAEGGEMSEGDEMYLDEDTINAILAAGGQIEYLD